MPTENFWAWIIRGFLSLFAIGPLAFLPLHAQDWGFAAGVIGYGGKALTIFFHTVGAFIPLSAIARLIVLVVFMEIWRRKAQVLNVLSIIRFFL